MTLARTKHRCMTLVDSLAYRSALDHIYHTVLPVRSTIQAGGRPGNIECGTLGTPIVGAPSLRYVYHTVLPVRSTVQASGRTGGIECGTLGTPIVGAQSLRHVYHTVLLVRSTVQAGGRPGNIECGTLGTPIVGALRRHVDRLDVSFRIQATFQSNFFCGQKMGVLKYNPIRCKAPPRSNLDVCRCYKGSRTKVRVRTPPEVYRDRTRT